MGRGASNASEGASSTAGAGSSGVLSSADALAAGQYELISVISHIGRNTDHGHYVCHIKKNNQWVLFNDDKVGWCTCPL